MNETRTNDFLETEGLEKLMRQYAITPRQKQENSTLRSETSFLRQTAGKRLLVLIMRELRITTNIPRKNGVSLPVMIYVSIPINSVLTELLRCCQKSCCMISSG